MYSFLAKRSRKLVKDYFDDTSDFKKLCELLSKIEIDRVFDMDENIKYKVVDRFVHSNFCGIMFFGGEKLDDIVNDKIEDITQEFDYRKKHIFCFIYNNIESEVYFNTFGGRKPSGNRIKSVIDKILLNYEVYEQKRVLNF